MSARWGHIQSSGVSLSREEEHHWLGRRRVEREPEPWQEIDEPTRAELLAADLDVLSRAALVCPLNTKDTG